MLAAIKHYFMLGNVKNDLPPACDFQISLMINCESTWPGLIIQLKMTENISKFYLFVLGTFSSTMMPDAAVPPSIGELT